MCPRVAQTAGKPATLLFAILIANLIAREKIRFGFNFSKERKVGRCSPARNSALLFTVDGILSCTDCDTRVNDSAEQRASWEGRELLFHSKLQSISLHFNQYELGRAKLMRVNKRVENS